MDLSELQGASPIDVLLSCEIKEYTSDHKEGKKYWWDEHQEDVLGYVYAIQWGDGVKIGKTKNFQQRKKKLKKIAEYGGVSFGNEIWVSEKHGEYSQSENALHKLFKLNRVEGTEVFKGISVSDVQKAFEKKVDVKSINNFMEGEKKKLFARIDYCVPADKSLHYEYKKGFFYDGRCEVCKTSEFDKLRVEIIKSVHTPFAYFVLASDRNNDAVYTYIAADLTKDEADNVFEDVLKCITTKGQEYFISKFLN